MTQASSKLHAAIPVMVFFSTLRTLAFRFVLTSFLPNQTVVCMSLASTVASGFRPADRSGKGRDLYIPSSKDLLSTTSLLIRSTVLTHLMSCNPSKMVRSNSVVPVMISVHCSQFSVTGGSATVVDPVLNTRWLKVFVRPTAPAMRWPAQFTNWVREVTLSCLRSGWSSSLSTLPSILAVAFRSPSYPLSPNPAAIGGVDLGRMPTAGMHEHDPLWQQSWMPE